MSPNSYLYAQDYSNKIYLVLTSNLALQAILERSYDHIHCILDVVTGNVSTVHEETTDIVIIV